MLIAVSLLQYHRSQTEIVVFTAGWCPPCQVMKKEVWSNKDVQKDISQYKGIIFLDIDIPNNLQYFRSLGGKTIPRVFLIKGGKVIKESGYMNAADTRKFLSTM